MFRRNFMTQVAMSAAAISNLSAADTKTVTYKIKGFTCVTCAVGLDTLLSQQAGVVRSKSTYPGAVTTVKFKPSVTTEKALKEFISEMGFAVL